MHGYKFMDLKSHNMLICFEGCTLANFLSFPTFLNRFRPMWHKIMSNCKFGQKSGLDWVKMANLACFFYLFPQNEAVIDLEWLISPDSQLFPSFATKASHFWSNLKNFHFRGGTLIKFLNFPTFSNCFTPMLLKMTNNCKFGQKSGLDWVKMANLACFSIFSPKMRL